MKKTTTATVNKLFKERSPGITIYRGNGYYYFVSKKYLIHSLYVNSISSVAPEEIVEYALDNIQRNFDEQTN